MVSPLLLMLAIALTTSPVIATLGLEAPQSRPKSPDAIDTRLEVFGGVSVEEIREPPVAANVLIVGLVILGWLARLWGSGPWVVLLWVAATLTCVVWLPLMGVVVLGQGLTSHSPDTPAVGVIRALPFVAHAVAPVLALLAGATIVVRPWFDEPDPASVESRSTLGSGSTVEAIREPV